MGVASRVIAGWVVAMVVATAVLFTMPSADDFMGAPLVLLVVQLPALWALSRARGRMNESLGARIALALSAACVVGWAAAHVGFAVGQRIWSEPAMLELRPAGLGAATGMLTLALSAWAIERLLARSLEAAVERLLAVVTGIGLASCLLAPVSGVSWVPVAATLAWTLPLWALRSLRPQGPPAS